MHYQAPHGRGFGGFVVLPIRAGHRPAVVVEPRPTGWLAALFAGRKTPK